MLASYAGVEGIDCVYINYKNASNGRVVSDLIRGAEGGIVLLDNSELYLDEEISASIENCKGTVIIALKSLRYLKCRNFGIYGVVFESEKLYTRRYSR